MRPPINRKQLRSLSWWLPVITLALLLKYHYSTATVAELQWMLQPLADVLGMLTGHEFHRDSSGVWVSIPADVRLVQACAGVNFMLMSLLNYAWVFRPDNREESTFWTWLGSQLLLLFAVVIAAWATALLANTLRIVTAMWLQSDDGFLHAIGIQGADIHRLIGLAIYLPLLSLQMLSGNRVSRRQILIIPTTLYLLLMVIVPLVTGNAMRQPELFIEHLLQLAAGMAFMYGLYFLYCYVYRHKPKIPTRCLLQRNRRFVV